MFGIVIPKKKNLDKSANVVTGHYYRIKFDILSLFGSGTKVPLLDGELIDVSSSSFGERKYIYIVNTVINRNKGFLEITFKTITNPITAGVVIASVAGALGIGALVYGISQFEEVFFISGLAIVVVVGIGFLSDTGITKQIGKYLK